LRELDERCFVVECRNPSHCAHLRVAELAGGELLGDQRQVLQGARDTHSFLPGAHVESAVPAQPVRARLTSPRLVGGATVELGDQLQPAALGGGEVAGQFGDFRFEALERHRLERLVFQQDNRHRLPPDHGEAAPIIASG